MFKPLLIAAVSLLGVATAPVSARETRAAGTPEVTQPAPTPSVKQKYCIVEDAPASHMQRKTCLTREQWRARGVDLSAR